MNHEYVSTSNQSTALVAENAPCSSDPVASATGSEESATGDFYFGSDTRILSELDPDALDRAPLSRPGGPDAARMMVAAVEHGSGVALGPGRAANAAEPSRSLLRKQTTTSGNRPIDLMTTSEWP